MCRDLKLLKDVSDVYYFSDFFSVICSREEVIFGLSNHCCVSDANSQISCTKKRCTKDDDEEQGMARHEFLESVLLLSAFEADLEANKAFDRNALMFPDKKILKRFFEENFAISAKQLESRSFLEDALYTPDMDHFVRSNLCVLQCLFSSNATQVEYENRTNKRMSLPDFIGLVTRLVRSPNDAVGKMAAIAFCKSKMLEEDEMATTNHTTLNFIDFVDALGRLSLYLDLDVSEDDMTIAAFSSASVGNMEYLLQLDIQPSVISLLKGYRALLSFVSVRQNAEDTS
jgi:hypothetical protein